MEINALTWSLTIAFIAALLAFDFIFHVRKAHIPTLREAAVWSAIYVGIALLFGLVFLPFGDMGHLKEYYAGYITEKALSVDNLFVFLVIIASFKVPRADQQKVLLFGIVFALFARSAFIFVGAAAINSFAWVFYIFGLILIVTAIKTAKGATSDDEGDEANNIMVRMARKVFHTSDTYDGDKLFTTIDGKRVLTPMLMVMVAIGGTDLLFALDSIPAIFGLTTEPYIVFTATAFSLMGLRQLYFLIDGLLDRLIYLSWGLALILGFIGVKLILHAMHENNIPWLNNGQPFHVPDVSIELSLSVIVGVLIITILASLFSPRGRAMAVIRNTEVLAEQYLALPEDAPMSERIKINNKLAKQLKQMPRIDEKHRHELIDNEATFRELVARARGEHDEWVDHS